VPDVDCDHVHVAGIVVMAESFWLIPVLSCTLVKLLTPVPPVQLQVVFQARVVPLMETREAQSEPEDAPDKPHWSSRREY